MSHVAPVSALVAAYLLGSLPFSYWIARRRGIDVRTVGSGNVGATNVMRSAGRAAGMLALLLDALKGTLAVMLGGAVASQAGVSGRLSWLPGACALAAVVGHLFPVWLRFRGGKGVATGVGAFGPLAPVALAVGLTVFLIVVLATRFVSLGSILAAVSVALAAPLTGVPRESALALAVAVALIVTRHHSNMRRLVTGTESRVGRRPTPDSKGSA